MSANSQRVDFRLVNLLLSALPYPLSKEDLIKELRIMYADEATLAWFERLSKTTFNSVLEVRALLDKRKSMTNGNSWPPKTA
jgi:Protein of unknown function (DUF2795)